MGRKPPEVTSNGHNAIQSPGAYQHVLVQQCFDQTHREARARGRLVGLMDQDDPDLAAAQAWFAERHAELVEDRRGAAISATSHQLPDGLPAPFFTRFPIGRQQYTYLVSPDDVITAIAREIG